MFKNGIPILTFATVKDWRQWLSQNFDHQEGVWLRFYKKESGKKTFSYEQALEEALCYGWIDGLANRYDDDSYIQRFTPRRSKSLWSKRNTERVEQLIEQGRMEPSGLKEVELAKKDRRWDSSYHSPSEMVIPQDFLDQLKQHSQALTFFKTLNKTNVYAIVWRLQTARKIETRNKRMQTIIEMLSRGKKFH